jgi:hypothetical protein
MGDFSLGMPDTSDNTYLTMPHMVSDSLPPFPSLFLSFSGPHRADRPTVRPSKKTVALSARLHSNSPLAPGHPLSILCEASKTARALALPARIPAHARAFAASGRVIPLPKSDAYHTGRRGALECCPWLDGTWRYRRRGRGAE